MLRARAALLTLAAAACFVDEPAESVGEASSGTSQGSSSSSSEVSGSGTATTGGVCGDGHVDAGEGCDDGNEEVGDGCDAMCVVELPPLYAFVTKTMVNGAVGSLAMADAICQMEAEMAGLGGTYMAWLSLDNTQAPLYRFAEHERAYVLPGPDAPLLAVGTAGLFGSIHERGLNRYATGVELDPATGCSALSAVWTGTANTGMADTDTCEGFTSADPAAKGRAGRFTANGASWTDHCALTCDVMLPIYCFQAPP